MKYLFINTVAGFGSTGKIVLSACEALQAQGHTCVIAYGRQAVDRGIPTAAIGSPSTPCGTGFSAPGASAPRPPPAVF